MSTLLSVASLAVVMSAGACDSANKAAPDDKKAETKDGAKVEAAADGSAAAAAGGPDGVKIDAKAADGTEAVIKADGENTEVNSGDAHVKTDAEGTEVKDGDSVVKTNAEGTVIKDGDAEISVGKDGKVEMKGIPGM